MTPEFVLILQNKNQIKYNAPPEELQANRSSMYFARVKTEKNNSQFFSSISENVPGTIRNLCLEICPFLKKNKNRLVIVLVAIYN